jgi:membrane dipeptidase
MKMRLSPAIRAHLRPSSIATVIALMLGASVPGTAQMINGPSAKDLEADKRIEEIHKKYVFADMHSHPSHFHRDNVARFDGDEIGRYKRAKFDIIVAPATTDNFMTGNFTNRDGSYVERRTYKPKPGDFFIFTMDRIERPLNTVLYGDAVLATSPDVVLKAREEGQLTILLALEGAEALEEDISKLKLFYDKGVRFVQIVHIQPNALGSSQIYPYTPTGLTEFGKQVIKECNRLGIVVDLAHANDRTRREALAVSTKPMVFSHTASHARWKGDRGLDDAEMREIAEKGGVIGMWTNIDSYPSLKEMVDDIDYVKNVIGVDHVGIGSDLRGLDSMGYTRGFGTEGNFVALERALVARGYSDDDIGKILGGNFFRVWKEVAKK